LNRIEAGPLVPKKLGNAIGPPQFLERAPVHNVALSDQSGEVRFYIPANEPKNGCIVPPEFHSDTGAFITVPCTTVDDMARDLSRLDFIKIDAEGAEAAIIDGMGIRGRLERADP